jgi:two-component system, NarL family, sensor histidine kinase UhpB
LVAFNDRETTGASAKMPPMRLVPASFFWRVFAANAFVFLAGGLLLAFTPATVSSPIKVNQGLTLAAGIAVMLLVNLMLMRRVFRPLATLVATMRGVDPLRPGQRVAVQATARELEDVAVGFNEMLARLESERRGSAQREALAAHAQEQRIAGELHDEVGQRLTMLLLMVANVQADADEATSQRLQAVRELAHELLDQLHDLVVLLRPAELDELGLARALAGLANTIEARSGVRVTRHLDAQCDQLVTPLVGLVAYRVAQEAMTNAIRHAPGSPIRLELTQQPSGALRLTVSDNGPGLAAVGSSGNGLRWMAERALLIDGTLDLDSSASGTTVTLTLPNVAEQQ